MISRPVQSKKRYLWAFLIGSLIFLIIFGLSYSLSFLEFQRVSNLQIETSFQIFEDKLDYSIFDQGVCSKESFEKISQDLRFQGRIIDDLEKKLGKQDKRVLLRKKFYTLIELEHFEFTNLLNEQCNLGKKTILFFYSNEKKDLDRSEQTGELLNVIYKRNENIIIYSFDINLESDLIEKLKIKHQIEESPTLIINEKTKVFNPKNIQDIEKHLN